MGVCLQTDERLSQIVLLVSYYQSGMGYLEVLVKSVNFLYDCCYCCFNECIFYNLLTIKNCLIPPFNLIQESTWHINGHAFLKTIYKLSLWRKRHGLWWRHVSRPRYVYLTSTTTTAECGVKCVVNKTIQTKYSPGPLQKEFAFLSVCLFTFFTQSRFSPHTPLNWG